MIVPTGRLIDKWLFLVWSEHGPPSCSTRALLYALTRFGNKKSGVIYPSESTLAKMTGLTEKTVRKNLLLAERLGWISIRKDRGEGKAWANKEYALRWPPGFDPEKDEWLNDISEKVTAYREENRIDLGQ